jgi:hypothetical protein
VTIIYTLGRTGQRQNKVALKKKERKEKKRQAQWLIPIIPDMQEV